MTTNDSINIESSSNATFVNEFPNCKLRYIIHPDDIDGDLVTGLFTYNATGNPYSLTYEERPGKGMQRNHYLFISSKLPPLKNLLLHGTTKDLRRHTARKQ
jgi:hypothetical protein